MSSSASRCGSWWARVSTGWLRVFLEVARHGSFPVAARTLGWTQSAVSRQVAPRWRPRWTAARSSTGCRAGWR
ncbi:LysR family transcriptional regulator [Streptomyces sp. NPDC006265]|uniref:helix-turn-helix domain-containing protein n=1 Tax=Streptomyces sp. NPDC006265 TaxID=3156740 RepID=UPI0033AF649C